MNTNSSALVIPAPSPNLATNDIRAIKGPVPVPDEWAWLWWTLAALAIAALLIWLWRWWERNRAAQTPVIIVPPHVRAMQKLRAALALLTEPKLFCIEVSNALRVYLEERFELHAPDRTTEEFLNELQTTDVLSPGQKQTLADFLGRCDLVKFAKHEPTQAELQDLYEAAVRLVDETSILPMHENAAAEVKTEAESAMSNP